MHVIVSFLKTILCAKVELYWNNLYFDLKSSLMHFSTEPFKYDIREKKLEPNWISLHFIKNNWFLHCIIILIYWLAISRN